jgi:hypothetical protein
MRETLELISYAVLIITFIFTTINFIFAVTDRFVAFIRRIVHEELQKKSPSNAGKQDDGQGSDKVSNQN